MHFLKSIPKSSACTPNAKVSSVRSAFGARVDPEAGRLWLRSREIIARCDPSPNPSPNSAQPHAGGKPKGGSDKNYDQMSKLLSGLADLRQQQFLSGIDEAEDEDEDEDLLGEEGEDWVWWEADPEVLKAYGISPSPAVQTISPPELASLEEGHPDLSTSSGVRVDATSIAQASATVIESAAQSDVRVDATSSVQASADETDSSVLVDASSVARASAAVIASAVQSKGWDDASSAAQASAALIEQAVQSGGQVDATSSAEAPVSVTESAEQPEVAQASPEKEASTTVTDVSVQPDTRVHAQVSAGVTESAEQPGVAERDHSEVESGGGGGSGVSGSGEEGCSSETGGKDSGAGKSSGGSVGIASGKGEGSGAGVLMEERPKKAPAPAPASKKERTRKPRRGPA
eukprot:gene30937-35993_t